MALDLNLHRRHLDREARRLLVASRLTVNPEQSDRAIAETAGVDHKTVAVVRQEKIATGEIPQLPKRKGKDGKTRKQKAKPKPKPAAVTATDDKRVHFFATPTLFDKDDESCVADGFPPPKRIENTEDLVHFVREIGEVHAELLSLKNDTGYEFSEAVARVVELVVWLERVSKGAAEFLMNVEKAARPAGASS
jgi:hypothetical protein